MGLFVLSTGHYHESALGHSRREGRVSSSDRMRWCGDVARVRWKDYGSSLEIYLHTTYMHAGRSVIRETTTSFLLVLTQSISFSYPIPTPSYYSAEDKDLVHT